MSDDWDLIQRIRAGDDDAFTELFNRHKKPVLNLAYRFVHAQDRAEDIAQDVFLKIYRKHIPFDPRAQFSTWLYRVTVHAALDALRKRRHAEQPLDENVPDGQSPPGASLLSLEKRQAVQRAIGALPQRWSMPLILHQFQDMPYSQIAAILKITEKAVERRIRRAKDRLKKILKKEGVLPC